MFVLICVLFFFFKQKTAYEMRISDWSSDVCSSDLQVRFEAWESRVSDRYDFNSAEYITLPNPDYGRTTPGAIEPQSTSIRVPHHYTQVQIGRASCRERVCQYV